MAEENFDQNDFSDGDELSQISASPPAPCSSDTEQLPNENEDDQSFSLTQKIEENLQIDDELTEFIKQARRQGFNCLDLSKRNIEQFPKILLDFPSLQYLYLEGNQIQKLPENIFLRLTNLKWIDLRNNQLTELPSDGLAKHGSLRYLLLGGNLIRTLPTQLGKLKGLSALNLDGNPLDEPPQEIVKQGIKSIQEYLRKQGKSQPDGTDDEAEKEETSIDLVADVWASSDEEADGQRRLTRSQHKNVLIRPPLMFSLEKSKSETGFYETGCSNPLPPHLQSCIRYKRVSYSEMRIRSPESARRQRTKSDLKLPRVKTTNKLPTKNETTDDVYAVRAKQEQKLRRLKQQNIKIAEDLQKVKTRDFVYEWKEDYRNSQQELRRKRLVKGRDFQEAVKQAPFGIDGNYVSILNKDQQEFIEKAIRYESRRNRSPESAIREEEERRNRDRQVQARIREITTKIMKRRNEPQTNPYDEKRQSEFELRELRKLEAEVRQRRTQINNRFKAYTGDVKSRKNL